MNKEIKLNVNYEPYYGINVNIWGVEENGDDRKTFVKKMFEALKEDWINQNVDIAEWLDFTNTLNNELNGDELFENVKNNYLYIEELEKKAYNLGIDLNCIYKNRHSYSKSEAITIYEKLTPLLKNIDEFKEWFLQKLHSNNERIYCILFDDKESKKALISKLNEYIKREENSKEYYERQISQVNERINQYKEELKDLLGDDENVK